MRKSESNVVGDDNSFFDGQIEIFLRQGTELLPL